MLHIVMDLRPGVRARSQPTIQPCRAALTPVHLDGWAETCGLSGPATLVNL